MNNLKSKLIKSKVRSFLNYFIGLIFTVFILNLVIFNGAINSIKISRDQILTVINKTIMEFNEIDLQHLCIISNCKDISINNKYYHLTDNILKKDVLKKDKSHEIYYEKIKLTKDFNMVLEIKKYNLTIIKDTKKTIKSLIRSNLYINLYFFLMYTVIFLYIEFSSRRRAMLDRLDTSNTLREKNMRILTENIHHELNTPLAIIQGNVRKLEIEMSEQPNNILFNFDQMYASIDQIDNVLQRMSNFKNLKYSNGNKTLYDILIYSANSMKIYKKLNFEIELSDKLKQYKLKGTLKNGDLLNVVSNHFRNSIEAVSTKIVVDIKYNFSSKKLHIFIIDNGNGLRDRDTGLLLKPDQYNNIFKLYYSSKDSEGKSKVTQPNNNFTYRYKLIYSTFYNFFKKKEYNKTSNVRGVGLYLNRELMIENGGNVFLKKTSEHGTVFEIIVKAVKKI